MQQHRGSQTQKPKPKPADAADAVQPSGTVTPEASTRPGEVVRDAT
jgi:hypothetical protein